MWIPRTTALVLIVFATAFGFTGCWYSEFDNLNSEGTHYFHPDHMGSVKIITDTQGNVVSQLFDTSRGETVVSHLTRTDVSKYKYTAQEKDSMTELYYYK